MIIQRCVTKNDIRSIDDFIHHFTDGQETNLGEGSSFIPAAMLQWEFQSRKTIPADLVRFDWDPTKWSEFIQSFKTRVLMKYSLTDFICIERLVGIFDGEIKKCINDFGINDMFYGSMLKWLNEIGNPYLVS